MISSLKSIFLVTGPRACSFATLYTHSSSCGILYTGSLSRTTLYTGSLSRGTSSINDSIESKDRQMLKPALRMQIGTATPTVAERAPPALPPSSTVAWFAGSLRSRSASHCQPSKPR